jgi:hypothetical protein
MMNGTYRIKMTYITENNFNKYLKVAFNESQNDDESEIIISDVSEESSMAPEIIGTADNESAEQGDTADAVIENDDETDKKDDKNDKKEKFLAAAYSEVFYKNFEYSAPEKAVRLINDASEISQ